MRLNKQQLKVDILFIMSSRSAKMWKARELCPYLQQLGHKTPTSKQIKWVLSEMVEMGYLSRTKVKPQWSFYVYKMTGIVDHNTIPFNGGAMPERRSVADNVW